MHRRILPARVIPGFGPSLGVTLGYLCLVVLIPLAMIPITALALPPAAIWRIAADPRTLHALGLSIGAAFLAATLNAVIGTLLAWVLVRYRFPGRRAMDALIDLPFALPTAVAGIALAALYAPNGWIGGLIAPVKVAYTPLGIVVALTFVGLPFVVRTVQPVLGSLDAEAEEAAATLGASRWQSFTRVVLPLIGPSILTGFGLALARGIGEYGSVIFIAGNLPMVSEIAPLLIVIRLEEHNTAAAAVIALMMLIAAFALLLAINLLQTWQRRRLAS